MIMMGNVLGGNEDCILYALEGLSTEQRASQLLLLCQMLKRTGYKFNKDHPSRSWASWLRKFERRQLIGD